MYSSVCAPVTTSRLTPLSEQLLQVGGLERVPVRLVDQGLGVQALEAQRCPIPRVAREISCLFASVAGQFAGGGLSGVCGPAEEVGEQLEFGVAVFGADLVH